MKSQGSANLQSPTEAGFRKLSELLQSFRTWSRRGVLALLDQGLISGSNFVTAILLARWLTPQQYGSYALAFEVFLFISATYGSLILEPMTVFGSSVYSDNFRSYIGSLLRIHCVLSVVMTAVLFAAAAVMHAIKPASLLPDALVGISVASPCLLLFWLVRRGFYVVSLPQKAVLGASVYSAVLLVGVAILYAFKWLSPYSVFLLLGATALVAAPLMLRWLMVGQVRSGTQMQIMDIVRRHWGYGRWAVANSVVIWFSSAIYYPLLGSFFTLADTGKFKALMNLSSPIGQAFVAISLLSLPHASRVHHQGRGTISKRLIWRLTLIYLGGSCLYWAVLLPLRGPIFQHLYAGKYMQVMYLLPWIALGSTLKISATAQTLVLKAMRSPSMAFVAYSSACVVAVLVGVPCTRWFGLRGAIFAWVLSSAANLAGAVFILQRKSRQPGVLKEFSTEALVLREETSISTQG